MVWKLKDLCLKSIQENLDKFPNLGVNIPTLHKEMLIERLSCHDLFFPERIRHINRNLFTNALRHVNLQRCDQITDNVLQLLGKSGCKLEVLVLNSLKSVTDPGVQAVLQNQDSLMVLHIKFLPLISHKALSTLASPKLWSLKVVQPPNVSKTWWPSPALASLLANNKSIKVLKISTDVQNLSIIARSLGSTLEELKASFQQATDEEIDVLAEYCPNLKRLDLNGAMAIGKNSLIKLFQACTQLEFLDLGYCNRLASAPECEVLWTLPQSLTTLSLCGLMLGDKDILVECITRLPKITDLKLCGVTALSDDTLTKMLKTIGPRITRLNLSGVVSCDITDNGMKAVTQYCTNLEILQISLLRQVTGVTLMPFFTDPERAAKLKSLFMNSKKMEISVLDQLALSCPNLEMLDLGGLTIVTDALIISLADHAPRLTYVNLKGCKMLTDAAICHLAGRCSLKSLVLSGVNSLTDKSIFCLASSCPQLEEIYLSGCASISPVAVQYLRDCCVGRLHAVHNIPNASPNQVMGRNLDTGEFCRIDLL